MTRLALALFLSVAALCQVSAADDDLAGISAQIFVLSPDGTTFTEGRLNFSKHEMKVSGAINTALGLQGGEYTRSDGKDKKASFTCTVKLNANGIATITWRGTIDKGNEKEGKPSTGAGTVTVVPLKADAKPTTLKFVDERPRPKK
jgi:hypothetical protein